MARQENDVSKPIRARSAWTESEDAILRAMWTTHSASLISEKIGAHTRNAVIGRARRLKLPEKVSYPGGSRLASDPRPRRKTYARAKPKPAPVTALSVTRSFLDSPRPRVDILVKLPRRAFLPAVREMIPASKPVKRSHAREET